jgi:cyanophycinase
MRRKGKILIIGGAEINLDDKGTNYHSKILTDIYPKLNCKSIVVISMGGTGLRIMQDKYTAIFKKKLNLELEFIVLNQNGNNEKKIYKERLEHAHSIFFSGGNQIDILKLLQETSFIDLIRKRYNHEHIFIAGTSAGAMMMSEQMIFEGSNSGSQIDESLKITPGLGLIPNSIIDTHFIARGRIARLAHAINRHPNLLGIGLEENTAVLIDGEKGFAQCFGDRTVTLMERIKQPETQQFKLNSDAICVKTAFLTHNNKFSLTNF